jgi:hypothetical protein
MSPKKIDKRRLAAKLEEITESVSNRGVYITISQGIWYDIIDYVTKNVILSEIPGKDIADKVADRLNSHKTVPQGKIKTAKEIINNLHKHYNDIVSYRNIVKNSNDVARQDTAWLRLTLSKQHLEKLTRDLQRI